MKPRIAVPTPTSTDLNYNQQNELAYAACLQASGAIPVAIPLDLSAPETLALLATCQGVCLTGSPADVEPARYGHEREVASAPADAARERTDMILLESVLQTRRPLLAICFGLQHLNVFLGGTLVQDLTPMPVNHAAGASVGLAHMISVEPRSMLATISGSESTLNVSSLRIPANSSHHQAVGIPGAKLWVTGRCPQDGVIEALELEPGSDHPFLIGVQWHPERTFDTPVSRGLFAGLVGAAREWRSA